jgi:pyrroline-5-carboxylate reductase
MLKKKIAFIGPGVMAEAMIAGLLRKKLAKPENITVAGPREERGQELQKKYRIKSTTDNTSAASHADVVVLSVKPQRLSEVMKGLKGIRSDALVLSIIAGANMKKIGTGLKHKAVVRSMPNTPGQIGEGITVWTCSKEVTEEQQEMARAILGALGEEVFVEDEGYLDMATALSGSGPAYVFLFTEALIDAGVHMSNSSCKRSRDRFLITTTRSDIPPPCGIKSHPPAEPPRRRCIISRRQASAPPSHVPSGRRINAHWSWARRSRCISLKGILIRTKKNETARAC